MNNSLFNEMLAKLQAMGVERGAEHLRAPEEPAASRTIDQVVDGEFVVNEFGRVFIVENRQRLPFVHGEIELVPGSSSPSEMISNVTGISHGLRWEKKLLYFDTETSGLSTGAGTFVFLYGFAYFENDELVLRQYFMPDPGEEGAIILELDKFLSQFDMVVSFNGKSFDAPILKTRFALNGYRTPLGKMDHLDLLHYARRIWKLRLPSRALKDLEREIFHFRRSEDEVPGWMVPVLYTDYLFSQDATPLKGVFYHNQIDVLSLAVLHQYLARLMEDQNALTSLPLEDRYSIARLFRSVGLYSSASSLFLTLRGDEQTNRLHLSAMMEHAAMHKRNHEWDEAVELWQQITEVFESPEALIELAKYQEHRVKDYAVALELSQQAAGFFSRLGSKIELEECEIRCRRLETKINRRANE